MGKHVLIWLLIMIFTPLALPALLSQKTLSIIIRTDYNDALKILGEKEDVNQELIALYKRNLTAIAQFAQSIQGPA
jgi:hypothetical protein